MKTGDLRLLSELLEHSRRIVFFGGAGVSTASGIPDFRSAKGIYAEGEPDRIRKYVMKVLA